MPIGGSMSLRNIAREAGVSVTTVSRILNDIERNKVSEATRRRVLDIARTMRYRPNQQARSLVTRRPPNTLGLVVPYHSQFFRSFYFSEISCGALDMATTNGMDVNLLVLRDTHLETYLDFVAGNRVAGVILLGTAVDDDLLDVCRDSDLPFVVINNMAPTPNVDSVKSDNRGGAREMAHHLLRLGHTRIAFIAGPAGMLDAQERLQGYRDAHAEAGIPVDEDLILPGAFNEKSGREAMRILLTRKPRPTAVFAANDQSAIGALQVLKRERVRVPDEIAVAGFDDIPTAQYMEPALSTVHQSIYRLGEKAAEVLVSRISGGSNGTNQHVIRTRLVVRESCGARDKRQ